MPLEKFIHVEEDFQPGKKYYKIREVVLPINEEEILYIVKGDRGCNPSLIIVPGIVVSYRSKKNEWGLYVSEVKTIEDEEKREEVRKVLQELYGELPVNFW